MDLCQLEKSFFVIREGVVRNDMGASFILK